jgi:hypothetical protein
MQLAGQKRWAVLHNSRTWPARNAHCCLINYFVLRSIAGQRPCAARTAVKQVSCLNDICPSVNAKTASTSIIRLRGKVGVVNWVNATLQRPSRWHPTHTGPCALPWCVQVRVAPVQAGKSQKGRWAAMDAGNDTSDDQVRAAEASRRGRSCLDALGHFVRLASATDKVETGACSAFGGVIQRRRGSGALNGVQL